jgi:uncharacterized protein (TIGR03083 family)
VTRTREDCRAWAAHGFALLAGAVERLDEFDVRAASGLPEWSRGELVAHVAANAEALGNLATWARTGVPTPMYASPEARAAGIAAGATMSAAGLRAWLHEAESELLSRLDRLDAAAWDAPVTTAQGRVMPATEIPWLRARETCVHAVDLATGVSFADLPDEFLVALADEVVAKRAAAHGPAVELAASDADAAWVLPGAGPRHAVVGELAHLLAYLTGRTHPLRSTTGAAVPPLPPWL